MKLIYSYWLMLFYKVVWIDNEDKTGYFCKKRIFAWILVFPIILIFRMIINLWMEFINLFEDIFSYDIRYITTKSGKKEKLTFHQKRLLTHRLNT